MAGKINERMREKGLLEHNHPTIRSAKNGHKTSGPELVRVKFNQTGMVRVVLRSISRSRPMKLYVRTLTILVAIIALVTPLARASGQAVGAARPFPDLQRVTADYPDDAERFIVFNLLYSWIGENTAGRQSKAAYELGSAYARAAGEIQFKYEQQGRNSEVFKRFDARSNELFRDPRFKRSVLEKYHLSSVPVKGPAAAGGSTEPPLFPEHGNPSDAAIQSAFFEAAPVWGAGVILMIALSWVFMRSSGCALVTRLQRRDAPGDMPQLPESLRVVAVPGRRYEVELESGQVVEKETTLRTRFQTTTTGGQVEIQGGIAYQTPIQTQTTVTNTQEDLVWVRTPDERETSWTLLGGSFKTRQGHIISSIGRPLSDGTRDFLLAYNHTTGQLEQFAGLRSVHIPKFLWPLFLVAFFGSLPGAYGLGIMFHRLGGLSGPLPLELLTLWIVGGIGSAIVAFIVVWRMMRRIMSRRNATFASRYIPGYLEFFAQATPALVRRFNAP